MVLYSLRVSVPIGSRRTLTTDSAYTNIYVLDIILLTTTVNVSEPKRSRLFASQVILWNPRCLADKVAVTKP